MIKWFVSQIVTMVGLFGSKPSVFKILSTVLTFLPSLISQAIDFSKADAKGKVDELLEALDAYTGSDTGAVHLFPHMPPEREEVFWDAIKTMVQEYAYNKLKLPGYYIE